MMTVMQRHAESSRKQSPSLDEPLRLEGAHQRRLRLRDIILAVATPIVLLGIWEFLGSYGYIDTRIFPPPTQIALDGVDVVSSGRLPEAFGITVTRLAVGFASGAVTGIVVGMTMGLIRPVRAAFAPLFSALYALPKIAILPVLLLIFGFTETSRVLLVTLGVFFVLQINTFSGIRQMDPGMLEAASAYRARGWRKFRFVLFPATLPSIFTGLRVAAGMAVIIVVSTEFVAADSGVGHLIWNSWQLFEPGTMYVGIATSALLGAALTGLVAYVERVALPWRHADSGRTSLVRRVRRSARL